MSRTIATAALLFTTSMLPACAQTTDGELSATNNPTVYSVHQPVVQRTDYVLDLAGTGNGLASSEAARLQAWFDTLQLGYGDRISVDQGAYADPSARAEIARVAREYGLLLADGSPVTAGSVQPGGIRVIVSRTSAGVPSCPDWSYAAKIGAPISTDSNYGCATNSNLAAMIADPNDLVLGQSGASAGDADAAAKAVRTYRDRTQTGVGGKLSSEQSGGKQ